MFKDISKRLGHIPSTASAIVVGIVWSAMVFTSKIEVDGPASLILLGFITMGLGYKTTEKDV